MRIARKVTVIMVAVAALTAPMMAGTAAGEVQRDRAVQRPAGTVPGPAARPRGRRVRPPVRAVRAPARRVWVGAGFYRPYYHGYHNPFWNPFYGPYGYGLWGHPYPYGGYVASSAVRLQVTPRETEVFVDGYYVGIVDSFDGIFQRLRLPPGDHEIELYLKGHESIRWTLYMTAGDTYRVRHHMAALAPGAPAPTRPDPEPAVSPATARAPSARPLTSPGVSIADELEFGRLVVRVQPADAAIVVDGERWTGHEAVGELVLDLGAGTHRLEVSSDGHHPYNVDVDIAAGENTVINVSLPPADSDGG